MPSHQRQQRLRRRRGTAALVAIALLGLGGSVALALASAPADGSNAKADGTTVEVTTISLTDKVVSGKLPPTPPRRPSKPAPRPTFSLAAVGDMTFGRSDAAATAESVLAGARHFLGGDVVLGNLETTLGSGGAPRCAPTDEVGASCYSFQAPASTALGLRRIGFTVVNVANNHADDYGAGGQRQTSDALRKARLSLTGKPGEITPVLRRKVRVAMIGFAPYGWANDLRDVEGAQRLVRTAARRADVVIVTMHAGGEGPRFEHVRLGVEAYHGENRGDVLAFTHAIVEAGADLVVGSGPHVLRGMRWYRGRLIAFSLGNFSGYHTLNTSGDSGVSAVLQVSLDDRGRFVRGRLTPIRLAGLGSPVYDASHAAWRQVNRLGRSDFGRAAALVDGSGRIRAAGRG